MKTVILLIFLFPAFIAKAQLNGSIKGSLSDSSSHEPISAASISILRSSDRSFITYCLANKLGEFECKNLPAGEYILVISSQGYSIKNFSFNISKTHRNVYYDKIKLSREYKTLDEATVSSSTPVRVKDDSISFRLDYFKTAPGSSLEDALKKLPGIQVDKNGSIKAMGETVQKLYVDGKEFFGNDPSVAAKNLTADMVDQVQVFDDMSEQSKFTKMDDGSRTKALNIRLKKDRKKGEFGKLHTGIGSEKRYDVSASWNHFNDLEKLSLTAGASNTNKQAINATTQTTGSPVNTTGATGINSFGNGGINYNTRWFGKIDLQSSYHFNQNSMHQDLLSYKKYFFPGDSSAENTHDVDNVVNNFQHRLNTRFEFAVDSFHSFIYSANLSGQSGENNSTDNLHGIAWGNTPYISQIGSTVRNDERNSFLFSGELLYRIRFRAPGRTLSFGWRNNISDHENENKLQSSIRNYDANRNQSGLINHDQVGEQQMGSRMNYLSATFTNALGRRRLIELNYSFNRSVNNSDKKTFDLDQVTGNYDIENPAQTNFFDFASVSSRVGINLRETGKKYNYQIGSALQVSDSRNRSVFPQTSKDSVVYQHFTNFFPSASFYYRFNPQTNIRIAYNGRTSMPTVSQLQAVADLTNPLFIRTGNPLLKQEFTSNLSLNFNHFQPRSNIFLNSSVVVNSIGNKVVNSIDSLSNAVVLIKPVNLGGAYSVSTTLNAGIMLKNIKGLTLNYNLYGLITKDPQLVFQRKYFTTITVLDQSLGLGLTRESFDMNANAGFVYSVANYTVQSSKVNFIRFSWSADFRYRFKKQVSFITNLGGNEYDGRTPGFNQEILLWNLAVSKRFLKDNKAELKLTAYDLLGKDRGINRTVKENYLEDTRYKVLQRFCLLSFTYNFRKQK